MMAMGDRWARMRSSVNMAACSREDDQNRSLAECGSLRCGVDHNLTADHHLGVSMPVLIAARGADRPVVGMRPLRCAGCGGRRRRTSSRRRATADVETVPYSSSFLRLNSARSLA